MGAVNCSGPAAAGGALMDSRTIRLDSWGAVYAALQSPDPEYYSARGASCVSRLRTPSDDWDFKAGWTKTVSMAGRAGWPEGARRVKRFTDRYVGTLAAKVHLPTYTPEVTGEFFDVGLLMSGEPEHWYQREESPESIDNAGRVYRVVLNIGASAIVDAKAIERRGAAAAAVIQLLELAGLTTELVVSAPVKRDSVTFNVEILLKAAGEPLDIDRLALIAIHPAGLRRIAFRLFELYANDTERDHYGFKKGGGYGRPYDAPERGDVYAPAMFGGAGEFAGDDTAMRWIESRLAELGVMGGVQ